MSSNYPYGFANGLTVRGVPIDVPHPGEVFWVNNSSVLAKNGVGGSNGNDGTYRKPFSTLDYAIGRCTAGRGDVIYLMPGHAENVAAANDIDFDVADVTVIGLGSGSKIPKFTATADADLAVVIDAANIVLVNLRFTAAFADVGGTGWVDLNTGGFEMHNCIIDESTTGENWVNFIAGAAVNDCKFINNRFFCNDAVNGQFLASTGAMDAWEVIGNTFIFAVAQSTPLAFITGAKMTNWIVKYNDFHTQEDTEVALGVDSTAADCSGVYAYNTHHALITLGEGILMHDVTGMSVNANWVSYAVDEQGALLPPNNLT